jgi:hypothetical protein
MIAVVSSDGRFLRPLVIAQRKRDEVDIIESGLIGDHLRIIHQERGAIDRHHFDEGLGQYSFQWCNDAWQNSVIRAVVPMPDHCPCHTSAWFLDEALALRADLHFLPLHSLEKTQPLDFRLFGLTKRALTKVGPDSNKSYQSNQLL